jgi:uncharacterized integral membrane protein
MPRFLAEWMDATVCLSLAAIASGSPHGICPTTPTMKLTWILVILLLVFVAIFSVQNAAPITVYFLPWEITMSAALVIQLAALLGALVGLATAAASRRHSARSHSNAALEPERTSKVSGDVTPPAHLP